LGHFDPKIALFEPKLHFFGPKKYSTLIMYALTIIPSLRLAEMMAMLAQLEEDAPNDINEDEINEIASLPRKKSTNNVFSKEDLGVLEEDPENNPQTVGDVSFGGNSHTVRDINFSDVNIENSGCFGDGGDRCSAKVENKFLKKIVKVKTTINVPSFSGYVEIDGNTCGAAMLASGFNACHNLVSPVLDLNGLAPKNFSEYLNPDLKQIYGVGEETDAVDKRDSVGSTASHSWVLNTIGSLNNPEETETSKSALKKRDSKDISNRTTPVNLKDSLSHLCNVAKKFEKETLKQLEKQKGNQLLESRAKRLSKAQKSLSDPVNPQTWQIGNLEIEKAAVAWGLKFSVLIERQSANSNREICNLDEKGICNWLFKKLREELADRNTALLFHLHGVLNVRNFFGHFALIFAVAEYQIKGEKEKQRVCLTARSYQGPRHWVPLEKVHRWIFKSKFPGYLIYKVTA